MVARDPHRFVNELDAVDLDRLISRLESRAQDPVFVKLYYKYLSHLSLPPSARILEVGCGTGAMLRLLARHAGFKGQALGIDQSRQFIEAAQELALRERVDDRLSFDVGDAHALNFPPGTFDTVIAHTLVSHVTDPTMVLSELAWVVKPGGAVVIFDGDYASLTYAYPDHGFGRQMDAALATAAFNNPRIMRDLPRLLPKAGLVLDEAWGDAVVEIGKASYFRSLAEVYAPYVKRAGLLPAQAVDVWLNEQYLAMEQGRFFAACNYYTYLMRRADWDA